MFTYSLLIISQIKSYEINKKERLSRSNRFKRSSTVSPTTSHSPKVFRLGENFNDNRELTPSNSNAKNVSDSKSITKQYTDVTTERVNNYEKNYFNVKKKAIHFTDFENLRDTYIKTHDEFKQLEKELIAKNETISKLEKQCEAYHKQEETIKELNENCSKNKKEKEIVQKRYDELVKEKSKLLSNLNTLSLALNMAEGEKNTSLNKVAGVNNKVKKVEKDNQCMKGKVNLLSQKISDLEEHIVELEEEIEKERDLRTFYEHKYQDKSAEYESLNNEFLIFKAKNTMSVANQINKINISDANENIANLTTEVSAFKVSPAVIYNSCNSNSVDSPYTTIKNINNSVIPKHTSPFTLNSSKMKKTVDNKENCSPNNQSKNYQCQQLKRKNTKHFSLNLTTQGIRTKTMTSLCELLDDQNSNGLNSSAKKFKVFYEQDESIGKLVLTQQDFLIERKNFSIMAFSNYNKKNSNKAFTLVSFNLEIKSNISKEKLDMRILFQKNFANKLRETAYRFNKLNMCIYQVKNILKKRNEMNKFTLHETKSRNQCLKEILRCWSNYSLIEKTAYNNSYIVVEKMNNMSIKSKNNENRSTIEKLTRKISFDSFDNQYKSISSKGSIKEIIKEEENIKTTDNNISTYCTTVQITEKENNVEETNKISNIKY